jgi:VanZ family protein
MIDPPRSRAKRLRKLAGRARTLAIIYLVALFVGTHIPIGPGQMGPSLSDKWIHFGAYAVLTVLVLTGWELTVGILEPKHYFAVWLAGALYGVFDEVSQTPVGRSCDMNDWLADVLGIVCGLVAFRLCRAVLHRIIAWTIATPGSSEIQ